MNRFVKIPSREGGKFTQLNNRINFDLEAGSVYDLSQSYLNLYSRVDTTDAVGKEAGGEGIYNFKIGHADEIRYAPENITLIKNCRLTSSLKGQVEDIRDVNHLRANLKLYTESKNTQEGHKYSKLGQVDDKQTEMRENIYREFHKEGKVISREMVAPVRIPMTELFETAAFPLRCDKLGACRVHLELDFDKITTSMVETHQTADYEKFTQMDDVTYVNAGDLSVLELSSELEQLELSPFFVGCKVAIAYTHPTRGAETKYQTVKEIEYDQETGALTLTLNGDFDDVPVAGNYTNITAIVQNAGTRSFAIDYAELTVAEMVKPPAAPSMLQYTTWTTEQFNALGAENFQRIFQMEPEAVNMMLFFTDSILSYKDGLESFRIRIDNEDVTDRDIEVSNDFNTGLDIGYRRDNVYYDLLNKTMLNSGLSLKSLNEMVLDERRDRYVSQIILGSNTENKKIVSIMAPLPQTMREKQVQFNMRTSLNNGINKFNIYKQVIKQIKL